MTMKFKAALLYSDGVAFYNVYPLNNGVYKAKLDNCSGKAWPPSLIELHKMEHNWSSTCSDHEIVRELTAAIEFRKI
jgi:hypothetical protein